MKGPSHDDPQTSVSKLRVLDVSCNPHSVVALYQADMAASVRCARFWLQVRGNVEEFVMYGVLHAAAAGPKQLSIDLREVPGHFWQHPFLQHALQVTQSGNALLLKSYAPPVTQWKAQ